MKDNIKQALDAYAREGQAVGDFLTAVLENNLMQAFGKADAENYRDLGEICGYVYNELPSACHGSPEQVRAWLAKFR